MGSGLWTRSIDSHWLVALTATPTDFASNDVYTIVCHYKSTNYVFDRVEVLNGDRIGRIRATSKSAANPLLYWLLAEELEG